MFDRRRENKIEESLEKQKKELLLRKAAATFGQRKNERVSEKQQQQKEAIRRTHTLIKVDEGSSRSRAKMRAHRRMRT